MAGNIYEQHCNHIVQGVPTVDDLTWSKLLAVSAPIDGFIGVISLPDALGCIAIQNALRWRVFGLAVEKSRVAVACLLFRYDPGRILYVKVDTDRRVCYF